ncbi:uncharacterized protein PITG_14552 [Phytophthora infestans T30-4]|uniref:Uncharacterized protein n=1 Tax=Phytophthora infestans (strain T30-4) TaxID=403677 RepID=D0NQI5_PHYIT|nr:uncharacterized protein PITG_14552 [Phytophthora infestans T30-4]EEY62933.1 hypothetical protein PITG_14552 [Phytophthora infestans T30-4]|eukprot:XP_002898456.1 hypothetical protein PITG_14552 [Phytophthora infestans T30-4]
MGTLLTCSPAILLEVSDVISLSRNPHIVPRSAAHYEQAPPMEARSHSLIFRHYQCRHSIASPLAFGQ